MNDNGCSLEPCVEARRRLLAGEGQPLVFVDWERVLFLHFAMAAEDLRPHVPTPLELELHQGMACVSLVCLTMRRFRPSSYRSVACLLRPLREERFLNLRTYVRHRDEPGAFFFHGWLSKPVPTALPSGLFGLPYAFGSLRYDHVLDNQSLRGQVTDSAGRTLAYRTTTTGGDRFAPCAPGSLASFAMERYTGFFTRSGQLRAFRIWHPRWSQTPLNISIEQDSLITSKFPWFTKAKFLGANFAGGFPQVWLGRAQGIEKMNSATLPRRHVLSSFYDMP